MIRLLQVEWLKLRTTRLTYGLLALAATLTALDTLLRTLRAGNGKLPPLDTAEGLSRPLTVTGFAILIAGVLGLTISSGEFRHNTATLTYLVFPNRLRVLVAKTLTGFAGGAIFGAAGAAMTTGVSLAVVAADGYPVKIGTGHDHRRCRGRRPRRRPGRRSRCRPRLADPLSGRRHHRHLRRAFFVESTLGGLYNSLDPYLPFTAATTLAGSGLGGGGFGFGGGDSSAPLPFLAAAALVTGVVLLISTLAAATTVQHDIT